MLEQVTVSASVVARLVANLAKPKLSPVAEAAAKHEPKVKSLLLKAVKKTRDAVPMRELESVLIFGGSGAPLYVLEDALKAWALELLGDGVEPAPTDWIRMRAASNKNDLPSVLNAALVSGAGAAEVCVIKESFVGTVTADAGVTAEQQKRVTDVVSAFTENTRLRFGALKNMAKPNLNIVLSTSESATSYYYEGTRTIQFTLDKSAPFLGKKSYQFGEFSVNNWSQQGVLRHEFGHHVHTSLDLDETRRSAWTSVFNKHVADVKAGATKVSGYALTNRHELFAESWDVYNRQGYGVSGPKLPSYIEDFFKKHLKPVAK